MPKKIVVSVGGPESKTYFVEVKIPKLRKTKDGVPEPHPNFLPEKPPDIQNDFFERRKERAQKQEDYMRNGSD